jgi:signal transduction histidine kinase
MVDRLDVLVRTQRNLLSSVSHELRSPLARINLTATLLKKRFPGAADKLLERLECDVARVDVLMGQLLTLSRLESGLSSGKHEVLDLAVLLEEVAAEGNFEAQAGDKAVSFSPEGPVMVKNANPLALRSAFENIIRNGIRFTQHGTEVRVALDIEGSASARFATISVSDSGPGVPEEFLQEIFKPFFRTPRSDESGPGNGLGLAIAYEAIRLHGGTISARNRTPGGLDIIILLPVALDARPIVHKPSVPAHAVMT